MCEEALTPLFTLYCYDTRILRELNLAIFEKAGCNSNLFTEWEMILFLSRKCFTWGARNAKFEPISVLTDQVFVGFVPKYHNQTVT